MTRRTMVATVVASLVMLIAAPAMAQDEDLAVRPGLWVTGFEFVGGDGDATAEPGERLRLWVDLQHGGDTPVTDVRGVLSSLTDDVRVIEDVATWADIKPGDNTRSRVAFVIEVSETAKIQDTRCGGPVGIEPMPVEEPPSSSGIEPGLRDPVTSEPADQPVSNDGSGGGSVSSDGTVTKDPDGGGSSGEPGQSEPGYAGEGASPEELEAEQRAAEQEKLEAQEEGEEPAPQEPAPSDPGAHVSLKLVVSSSLGDEELFVDNGIVCAMLESGAGAGADDGAMRDVALGPESDKVASTGRGPAIGSAAVLLGAMALTLASVARRRRLTA